MRGTTLYVDPEAPLLAHAIDQVSQKKKLHKGRMYYPSTPRTPRQQQQQQAAALGEGQGVQEQGEEETWEDEEEERLEAQGADRQQQGEGAVAQR